MAAGGNGLRDSQAVSRRSQYLPWHVAGQITDLQRSADDVVRSTGWVFNGRTGDDLTLAEFVASGTAEAELYLGAFDLLDPDRPQSIVEIGAGIGRMTCALTHRFDTVFACDIDAGFLERCRESTAVHGVLRRLRTVPVPDGRSLDLPDGRADVTFSYLTLQHCERDDALGLAAEAVRVTRPGGRVALNFRSHLPSDAAVLPLGGIARAVFAVPGVGTKLSRRRLPTRLAWQAARLDPHDVVPLVAGELEGVTLFRRQWRHRPAWLADAGVRFAELPGIHAGHWWLVATKSAASTGAARSA